MKKNILTLLTIALFAIVIIPASTQTANASSFIENPTIPGDTVSINSIGEITPVTTGVEWNVPVILDWTPEDEPFNNVNWYSFTPAETGYYDFQETTSGTTPYGAIYEKQGDTLVNMNLENHGISSNCHIYVTTLQAGQTYYLVATTSWVDNDTKYSAVIRKHQHVLSESDSSGKWIDYKYTFKNGTYHVGTRNLECMYCHQIVRDTVTEKHSSWDESLCSYCKFPSSAATLTSGTYHYCSGTPYLKVVITKPGYIVKKSSSWFKIYDSNKKRLSVLSDPTEYFPVKKGTYYLRPYNSDNQKVKYTFTSVPTQTNTTRKKAYSAAKGTAKGVIFYSRSTKNTQSRWFKIKLTSKRKIYLYNTGYSWPEIYNSKGKSVSCSYISAGKSGDYTIVKTRKVYPKGTYYIRFTNIPYKGKTDNYAASFKWK